MLQKFKDIVEQLDKLDELYQKHRHEAKAQKSFLRNVGSVGENKARSQTLETLKAFKNQIALICNAIQEDKHKNPSDKTTLKYCQLLHAAPAFFLAKIYFSYGAALFEKAVVIAKDTAKEPVDSKKDKTTFSIVNNSGMARALCDILKIERFGDLSSDFAGHIRQFKAVLEDKGMEHIKQKIDMKDIDTVITAITEHYTPKAQTEEAPASVVRAI